MAKVKTNSSAKSSAEKKTAQKTGTSSRSDKAKAAQDLALKLQAENEAKAKRQRVIFAGVLGAVVVAVIAVVVAIILLNPNSESNLSKQVQDTVESGQGPSKVWSADGSILISKNGQGDSAKISGIPTLHVYNDFICPACGNFDRTFSPTIRQIIDTGLANVVYHPLAWFDNTSPEYKNGAFTGKNYAYSTRAAAAAYYVGENAPSKYLDFMDSMYNTSNQPEEGNKYDVNLGSNEAIVKKIEQAGISSSIAQAAVEGYTGDMATDFPSSAARAALAGTEGGKYIPYAQAVGSRISKSGKVQATPAIFINDTNYKFSTPDKLLEDIKAAKAS
ncbi:MAG: thioredoxin domain-containing protein [Candidatus Ancillula sp.]|jgi:protein-disulfide isomerase|nr:thioredoxin domain-containing protein [Candidatus Ancillula sp.]